MVSYLVCNISATEDATACNIPVRRPGSQNCVSHGFAAAKRLGARWGACEAGVRPERAGAAGCFLVRYEVTSAGSWGTFNRVPLGRARKLQPLVVGHEVTNALRFISHSSLGR